MPGTNKVRREHVIERFPSSPNQRNWSRYDKPRSKLDSVNELYAEHGLQLRATKGWRLLSVKNDMAAQIAALMREKVPVPKVPTKIKGYNCLTRDSRLPGKGWSLHSVKRQIRASLPKA